jgi:hypothetical protein
MASPKRRMGARGIPKVKSGCQTCKYDSTRPEEAGYLINQNFRIRHKKCDETRPACSQCSSTGRRCDFTPGNHSVTSSLMVLGRRPEVVGLGLLHRPSHMHNLTHIDANHLDYFRLVCARDFALYFESDSWETLLLQAAHREPSIYHAVLAISALSRSNYYPAQVWHDPGYLRSAVEYSMAQYTLAIRTLNERLRASVEDAELAVLASILFINIEAFQGHQHREGLPNFTSTHLHGGLAIVQTLKSQSRKVDHLESALRHFQNHIEQFEAYTRHEKG